MRRAGALLAGVLLSVAACTSSSSPERSSSNPPGTTAAPTTAAPPVEITPLEGRPSAVAVTGSTLWVADDERGVVLRLDARNGRQLGAPIPVTPHPIAMDATATDVWVGDRDGDVTRIDAATSTAAAAIPLGGQLTDLVVDGATVWVADIEAGTVTPIDVATRTAGAPIVVPDGAVRVARTASGLAVTNLDHTVTTIDRDTHALSSPVTVGNGPIGIAAAPDGSLWVANSDDGTVQRVGGSSTKVGSSPTAVAFVGDELCVVNHDSHDLTRIATATGQVVGRVSLGSTPRDLAVADAGVWVAAIDPSAVILVTAARGAAASSS